MANYVPNVGLNWKEKTMIIDQEILKIVTTTGQYVFKDKDDKLYVVLPINEQGIVERPLIKKSRISLGFSALPFARGSVFSRIPGAWRDRLQP